MVRSSIACPHSAKLLSSGGINYDHLIPIDQNLYRRSFDSSGAHCVICGRQIDLIICVKEALTSLDGHKNFLYNSDPLGLPKIIIKVEMQPNQVMQIDLTNYGVPAEAKILYMNLTPQGKGGLWPYQLFQDRVAGESINHHLVLYPNSPSKTGTTTKLGIFVVWIDDSFVAPSFVHLVDSFIHYTHNEFAKSVRSAQLAIEEPFKVLALRTVINKSVFKKTGERLLNNIQHYKIIESIFNCIADDLGLPTIPNPIRLGLVELSKARNLAAHKTTAAVSEETARDGLVAALFGLHFILYFNEHLINTIPQSAA